MTRDEMMKSIEAFGKAAREKKRELERRHSDEMAKIMELAPGSSVTVAFNEIMNYLDRRMKWFAQWWSDIYGPKVADRKEGCRGNLGTHVCGSDEATLEVWLAPAGTVCEIPLWEHDNSETKYSERLPRVHDVKLDSRYPGDIKFEIFCEPDEVKAQLLAYKTTCGKIEVAFKKIYPIYKKMKAYEIERTAKEADNLAESLKDL